MLSQLLRFRHLIMSLALLIPSFSAFAETSADRPLVAIEEGIHYERIAVPQPTQTPGKVEVLELFWYACPHCHEIEPYLTSWLQKRISPQAAFVRMPAIFNPQWELLGRAYYTLELLNLLPQLHDKLFEAIHVKKQSLMTEAALTQWVVSQGVQAETFRQTFHSFAVESSINRAKAMVTRYGANGVPVVIVNGKFLVSPTMTGTYAGFFQVIDHLIQQESAAIPAPAAVAKP